MAFFTRLGHAVPEIPLGAEYEGVMVADSGMPLHCHPHLPVMPTALNPRNYPLARQGPPPHYPINYSSIDEEDDQTAARAVDV